MYIEPQSDIFLMKGINWSNNYNDTMYFKSLGDQYAFFSAQSRASGNLIFTRQSYQRHSNGVLRILCNAEMIMDCNYLMFQNKGHGGIPKWFYCFITNIEYINENTTEVYYEIDEIQTWLWELQLGQCFVEREIPETDNIFENLVPENLECGEYEIGSYMSTDLGEPYYLVQSCTDSLGHNDISFCNGLPSTIMYYSCPVYDGETDPKKTKIYQLLVAWFYNLQDNNPENIINISIVPKKIADSACIYDVTTGERTRGEIFYEDVDVPTSAFGNFHGYRPKNKKLFTYPYTMLRVSNNGGQIKDYKLEDFKTSDPTDPSSSFGFRMIGIANGLPSIMLTPIDYNGVYAPTLNVDDSMILTNFPTAPWVCDTYRAYLAQNKASITTTILSSIVGGISETIGNQIGYQQNAGLTNIYKGTGGGRRNPAGLVTASAGMDRNTLGAVSSIANTAMEVASALGKMSDAKRSGDTACGLTNADMLLVTLGRQRFDIYNYSIKAEMAKVIDDYFSMYGYAQHKVKTPNINSRPIWNYTQTKGCILKGSCPASTKSNISSIFDKGIRFWKNNTQIGNYTLNNSP